MVRLFVFALIAFVLVAPPAAAVERHLRYEAFWGGLHAADFRLSMSENGETFSNDFQLQSRGLVDWLVNLKLEAGGEGRAGDALEPDVYRVHYTNNRRKRSLEVGFDPESGLATPIQRTAPGGQGREEDEGTAERVPEDLRRHVVDPVTALAEGLRRAKAHLEDGAPKAFTIGVYDGRRRYDIEGEFMGTATRTVLEKTRDLYRLRLKTRAVAGFQKRHKMFWDDTAFDLYLTRDGDWVPVQIDSVGTGPVINLVEVCPSAEACRLPAKD